MNITEKEKSLVDYLGTLKSVAVAYSGGVDSTLLLKLAQISGIRYIGVIIDSPLIPRHEIELAVELAEKHSLNYVVINIDNNLMMSIKDNPENRCYICKRKLFSLIVKYAADKQFEYVADGTNADDKKDFRPGVWALNELKVISPFAALNIGKDDIRSMAKQHCLGNWNLPARACLASRIAYGDKINEDVLSRVECAEKYIRDFLISIHGDANRQYRVRVHCNGELARLEFEESDFELLCSNQMRQNRIDMETYFKSIGFKYIAIDLIGYRMGSMNESM